MIHSLVNSIYIDYRQMYESTLLFWSLNFEKNYIEKLN